MKRDDWNPRAVDRADHNGDCKPGIGAPPWWNGCKADTLVLIFDDRDHAGAVLVEGDFLTEDSPWLEIVDGDLVLATDNPPGNDFTAVVDGETFIFQDWSGG